MNTIIHGQNIPAGRDYFYSLKSKSKNPVVLNSGKADFTDFVEIFNSDMLFFEKKDIFLEEFFSTKKTVKQTEALLTIINQNSKIHEIVIWEPKELTKKQISSLLNFTEKKFDIPKTIFLFLDNILPNNGKPALKLFETTLQAEEPEFVFFMLIRQFRLFLALKDSKANEVIDELKKMPPWQKQKMQNQSNAFTLNELLYIYKKLFEIECRLKTGKLTASLPSVIAFFLLDVIK